MAAILAAYQGDDENRIIWLEPGAIYAAHRGGRARPAEKVQLATAADTAPAGG